MGIAYKICDCRHSDTRKEENGDLSYNNKNLNKKILLNDNIINLNNDDNFSNINPISKDTIEFNNQVNALAKQYKNNIPKKILNEKLKYNFILRKNKNQNLKNNLTSSESDSKNTIKDNSCFKSKNDLKKARSLLLSNKDFIYIGQKTSNDSKEGFGICLWNNSKTKYIGTFKNNKADGYGKFIDQNIKYKGQFKNDLVCGFGVFSKGQEFLYEGYWKDDLQDEYGYETWVDDSEYIGEYKLGKKHGLGIYGWSDGSRYEGFWNANMREGYGIMYYTKEKIYVGEWKSNLKEGFGELLFKDKKYIGFFGKDKKEGFGILYLNKLNKAFMGFWKKGKQLGFGKIMTRNKRKYGIWNEDSLVNWFKNEEEAFDYLESKGLKKYKTFFVFTLDDIRNYCINNDEFNSLLR